MKNQISEEEIQAVYEQIRHSEKPLSAGQIEGGEAKALLAIRELRRRGMITGAFLDDSTRAGDENGRFLYDAARLVAL